MEFWRDLFVISNFNSLSLSRSCIREPDTQIYTQLRPTRSFRQRVDGEASIIIMHTTRVTRAAGPLAVLLRIYFAHAAFRNITDEKNCQLEVF